MKVTRRHLRRLILESMGGTLPQPDEWMDIYQACLDDTGDEEYCVNLGAEIASQNFSDETIRKHLEYRLSLKGETAPWNVQDEPAKADIGADIAAGFASDREIESKNRRDEIEILNQIISKGNHRPPFNGVSNPDIADIYYRVTGQSLGSVSKARRLRKKAIKKYNMMWR